jgi:hypothetical protein
MRIAILLFLIACGSSSSSTPPAPGDAGKAPLKLGRLLPTTPPVGCTSVDLSVLIDGKATFVATIAQDLVGVDYETAIEQRIAALGNDKVACALLAIDSVAEAGKSSGAAAFSPLEERARQMIGKYKWTFATGPDGRVTP